jgi:hypothetical protein
MKIARIQPCANELNTGFVEDNVEYATIDWMALVGYPSVHLHMFTPGDSSVWANPLFLLVSSGSARKMLSELVSLPHL